MKIEAGNKKIRPGNYKNYILALFFFA